MFMTNFVECKHEVNANQRKPQIKWKRKSSMKCEFSQAYAISTKSCTNKQAMQNV